MPASHLDRLKTVRPRLWWAVSAASVALVAAGCGSSSPPTTTTNSAGAPHQKGAAAAFRFASCMREHGVSNFPDPQVSSSGSGTSIRMMAPGNLKSSATGQAALKACQGILPMPKGGGAQESNGPSEQALLELARCLRSHGYPRFPDPTAQGQLSSQMISAAGVNMRAPGFLQAAEGCASATHGQITAAMVAQAVNHSESGR